VSDEETLATGPGRGHREAFEMMVNTSTKSLAAAPAGGGSRAKSSRVSASEEDILIVKALDLYYAISFRAVFSIPFYEADRDPARPTLVVQPIGIGRGRLGQHAEKARKIYSTDISMAISRSTRPLGRSASEIDRDWRHSRGTSAIRPCNSLRLKSQSASHQSISRLTVEVEHTVGCFPFRR